jgi:predicted transcriptional regulator
MEVPVADTDLDFAAPSDEALDAEAEADFAAGRVIPHDRMREWLLKLAKGDSVPPPEV